MSDDSGKSTRQAQRGRHLIRLAGAVLCLSVGMACAPVRAQDGPLGNFLKELFGSGESKSRSLDLVDRHAAAASRELTRGLEQCDSLIASRQWGPAIQQLQYLVDLPEDSLTLKGASWVSIKRAAEERLLKLPDEGRRAYLNQYAQVAADELAQAHASSDFSALVQVASRFRLTPAGQTAADEVASLLADAGDNVAAAQWYSELEIDGADLTSAPGWKTRAAGSWRALGMETKARSLDPSTGADNPVPMNAVRVVSKSPSAGWTEIYGGPGRWNAVQGDQPLLLEEWSTPATQVPALQEDVVQRQADLYASSHRPIPVANMVAAHGLLAGRTLGGLEVRSVATGQLLWNARGRSTVESLLTRPPGDSSMEALTLGPGDNHEAHPLSSFFYRDATIGQLSTDGRRLFAISRKATLLSSAFDLYAVGNSTGRADHAFNLVVAIDFESGRTLWSTGGSKNDTPFEAPLAGVYFFGPPTVDGNELFVIGAAGADINLYCLEASTGLPKWKQFIAQYDTTKIEDDIVRQMWSCTPAVTRGLIYCPTNSGWLVAVDRHRRRLAWATRYSASEVSDRFQPQYSLAQLNERWAQTAPILSQGQIIFAPPELPDEPMQTEPQLFRFDAVTGRIVFKRGKADSIAIGGVYGADVLIISQSTLESWPPLNKWSARWSTPYPKGLTPCGLGVAINDVYWLPCLEGAVVGFELASGKIEHVLRNDSLAGKLGNLIVHGDRVLSCGPTGFVGLWQKQPFENQLAERLARNPRDLEARLRRARGHLSEQQIELALSELDSADFEADATPELLRAARDVQWECLAALLSKPEVQSAERWKQLESLADSPERQRVVLRLQIDRAIALADWPAAVEQCWKLLEVADGFVEDGSRKVHEDAWLAGRLLDLWTSVPESTREQLTQKIASQIALARPQFATAGPRLEKLFAFHPAGRRLSLELALENVTGETLGLAETRLATLARAPEPEIAATAATRLAELYRVKNCPADARRIADLAAKLPPETLRTDGSSLRDWLSAWNQNPPAAVPPPAQWNLQQARVMRLGAERAFETSRPVRLEGRPADWLARHRLEFATSWYGLVLSNPETSRREWAIPLAANGAFEEDWSPTATAAGSLLAVCSRGMLHVCSPRDGQVLWTWPLPSRFATFGVYAWAEEQLSNQPARTAAVAVNEFQANVGNLREGPLMTFAGDRLILLGQHELIVFDNRTGELLWQQSGIASTSVLVADEQTVCVSATTAGGPAAFRLLDGKPLASDSMTPIFARTFAVQGDMVLTRQGLPSLLSSGVRIVAEKPHSGETVWTHSVTADTLLQHLPGRELATVAPNGDVFVIEIDTGRRTPVGKLTAEQLATRRAIYVLSDASRIYVAIQRQPSYDFSNMRIPGIALNGELIVFDRQQARMLWRERVRDASLITASFADLPVVLLVEQSVPERRRNALDVLHLPELKLTALDKATGARVIEWAGATPHGTPAALLLDPRRQFIDIFLNLYNQNFNDRLRLQFGSSPPTTVP